MAATVSAMAASCQHFPVVGAPRASDLLAVSTGPRDERLDGVEQARPQRRELVVDTRGDDGVHRTQDHPVAFELAHGDRQHALADPVDLAAQLAEPSRSAAEQFYDQ